MAVDPLLARALMYPQPMFTEAMLDVHQVAVRTWYERARRPAHDRRTYDRSPDVKDGDTEDSGDLLVYHSFTATPADEIAPDEFDHVDVLVLNSNEGNFKKSDRAVRFRTANPGCVTLLFMHSSRDLHCNISRPPGVAVPARAPGTSLNQGAQP